MKKRKLFRAAAAFSSAVVMVSALALPASAGSLTADELKVKYGQFFEYGEGVNMNGKHTLIYELYNDPSLLPQYGEVTESGIENGFYYELLDNGTARITGADYDQLDAETEVLQIPEEIAGLPVAEIGCFAFAKAFESLPAIREVVVPNTVSVVGDSAFRNIFSLEERYWTQAAPIGTYRINIPENATYIGFESYYGCARALAAYYTGYSIVLPESLEYISSYAFDGNIMERYQGGVTVEMPKSLVMLSKNHFVQLHTSTVSGSSLTSSCVGIDFEGVPEEFMPLIQDAWGNGFEGGIGNKNVIGAVEVLSDYLGVEPTYTVNTSWSWNGLTVHPSRDSYSEEELEDMPPTEETFMSTLEFEVSKAKIYAPDLLPENVDELLAEIEYRESQNGSSAILAQILGQQSKPQETALAGDVNANGTVDIMDAIALARITAEDKEVNVTEAGLKNADVNGDGAVTAEDLNALLAQLAG